MNPIAATLLELALATPEDESGFLDWWRDAQELLRERFHLVRADLYVLQRGRYLAALQFPLPGTWKLVRSDRRWKELEKRRPSARLDVRQGRLWQAGGNPRDITTAELRHWVEERARDAYDFVLADTLPASSYQREHLPGAISLPFDEITPERAEAALGPQIERPVVVYCNGYG